MVPRVGGPGWFSRTLVWCYSVLIILFQTPQVFGEQVLTFEGVWEESQTRSFDLQIAEVDYAISDTEVTKARSEYFPVIQGRVTMEYLKDLTSSPAPVTTIGDFVLPSGTRFQNSVGLNLRQNLYDFGLREKKVGVAKTVREQKDVEIQQKRQELKGTVLEAYTQCLVLYQSLQHQQHLKAKYQDLFTMKKRLHEAGYSSKVDVADVAILLASLLEETERSEKQYAERLVELGRYTHHHYSPEDTSLSMFEEQLPPLQWDPDSHPAIQVLVLEEERMEQEVAMARRQFLPSISLYSFYNLYGSDPEQWPRALGDLQNRTVSFGISVTMPIFDGFKSVAELKRAKLSRERVALDRQKKHHELVYEEKRLTAQVNQTTELSAVHGQVMAEHDEKQGMLDRLSEQQLIERTQLVQQHIESLKQRFEAQKLEIERLSTLRQLKILREG